MSKPKDSEPLTLVVSESYVHYLKWERATGATNACWVRSVRQLTAHSGTGAKVFWLGDASKRPDYESLRAAEKANYFAS